MTLAEQMADMWFKLLDDTNKGNYDRRIAANLANVYRRASNFEQGEYHHIIAERMRGMGAS